MNNKQRYNPTGKKDKERGGERKGRREGNDKSLNRHFIKTVYMNVP